MGINLLLFSKEINWWLSSLLVLLSPIRPIPSKPNTMAWVLSSWGLFLVSSVLSGFSFPSLPFPTYYHLVSHRPPLYSMFPLENGLQWGLTQDLFQQLHPQFAPSPQTCIVFCQLPIQWSSLHQLPFQMATLWKSFHLINFSWLFLQPPTPSSHNGGPFHWPRNLKRRGYYAFTP